MRPRTTLPAARLRRNLFTSLDRVSRGNEIMVTSRGQEIALLSPVSQKRASVAKKPCSPPAYDLSKVAAFCRRHRISEMRLFGSIVRGGFHEKSDVDVLVSIIPERTERMWKLAEDLSPLFGDRTIDLLTRPEIASNPFLCEHVLANSKIIYHAY